MTNDANVLGASNRSDSAVREFEAFVVGSRDRLFRALAAHHGRQVAEEVLSEVYVYAWAHWVEVHRLSNPVGYLFRMGDRMAVRRSIRVANEPGRDGQSAADWVDDTSRTDLVETLWRLPADQRAAVLLVHAYGWTYREAAEVLDVRLTTLTNNVHRGTKQLRQQYARIVPSRTTMDVAVSPSPIPEPRSTTSLPEPRRAS